MYNRTTQCSLIMTNLELYTNKFHSIKFEANFFLNAMFMNRCNN